MTIRLAMIGWILANGCSVVASVWAFENRWCGNTAPGRFRKWQTFKRRNAKPTSTSNFGFWHRTKLSRQMGGIRKHQLRTPIIQQHSSNFSTLFIVLLNASSNNVITRLRMEWKSVGRMRTEWNGMKRKKQKKIGLSIVIRISRKLHAELRNEKRGWKKQNSRASRNRCSVHWHRLLAVDRGFFVRSSSFWRRRLRLSASSHHRHIQIFRFCFHAEKNANTKMWPVKSNSCRSTSSKKRTNFIFFGVPSIRRVEFIVGNSESFWCGVMTNCP